MLGQGHTTMAILGYVYREADLGVILSAVASSAIIDGHTAPDMGQGLLHLINELSQDRDVMKLPVSMVVADDFTNAGDTLSFESGYLIMQETNFAHAATGAILRDFGKSRGWGIIVAEVGDGYRPSEEDVEVTPKALEAAKQCMSDLSFKGRWTATKLRLLGDFC